MVLKGSAHQQGEMKVSQTKVTVVVCRRSQVSHFSTFSSKVELLASGSGLSKEYLNLNKTVIKTFVPIFSGIPYVLIEKFSKPCN
jgi:hypothetical protein